MKLTLSFFFRLGFVLAAAAGVLAAIVGARTATAPRYVTLVEKK